MKRLLGLLIILGLLSTSCSQQHNCSNGVQDGSETAVDCGGTCPPCPLISPTITFNSNPQPFNSESCCDPNFVLTGIMEPTITLVPTVITPNGDGMNDGYTISRITSSPSLTLTLILRDSLNVLIDSLAVTSSSAHFMGLQNALLTEGRYKAQLIMPAGTLDYFICIIDDNPCPNCLSTCIGLDSVNYDPSLQP